MSLTVKNTFIRAIPLKSLYLNKVKKILQVFCQQYVFLYQRSHKDAIVSNNTHYSGHLCLLAVQNMDL